MKYQLVLQWPASSADDYDALVQMENDLNEGLPEDCVVDGHDGGAGEMNIFILTNDPHKTFTEAQAILEAAPLWPEMRAAFRDLERLELTVLWPPNLRQLDVS
jgi:hypothetical protein